MTADHARITEWLESSRPGDHLVICMWADCRCNDPHESYLSRIPYPRKFYSRNVRNERHVWNIGFVWEYDAVIRRVQSEQGCDVMITDGVKYAVIRGDLVKFYDRASDFAHEYRSAKVAVLALKEENKQLREDVREMRTALDALWYAPGGPGAAEAREHFTATVNQAV